MLVEDRLTPACRCCLWLLQHYESRLAAGRELSAKLEGFPTGPLQTGLPAPHLVLVLPREQTQLGKILPFLSEWNEERSEWALALDADVDVMATFWNSFSSTGSTPRLSLSTPLFTPRSFQSQQQTVSSGPLQLTCGSLQTKRSHLQDGQAIVWQSRPSPPDCTLQLHRSLGIRDGEGNAGSLYLLIPWRKFCSEWIVLKCVIKLPLKTTFTERFKCDNKNKRKWSDIEGVSTFITARGLHC